MGFDHTLKGVAWHDDILHLWREAMRAARRQPLRGSEVVRMDINTPEEYERARNEWGSTTP
ncbi:MAG: hypothetical protein WD939_04720 [Dehalococcoidia bacterium]